MLAPPYNAEINSVEFMFGIWKQNTDKNAEEGGTESQSSWVPCRFIQANHTPQTIKNLILYAIKRVCSKAFNGNTIWGASMRALLAKLLSQWKGVHFLNQSHFSVSIFSHLLVSPSLLFDPFPHLWKQKQSKQSPFFKSQLKRFCFHHLWASASEPAGSMPTTQSPKREVGTIALWSQL